MSHDPSAADAENDRALERARFIDRFVAFSLDYFFVLAAAGLLFMLLLKTVGVRAGSEGPLLKIWLGLWLPLFVAYHALLGSDGRTTPGKRLLGLQVFAQDGYPPDIGRAALRAAGYLASSLLFGLGFLWALIDPQRRALHDRIAGTMVLESRPKGALAAALVWLAAVPLLAADVAVTGWPIAMRSYVRMQARANAEGTLQALALMEDRYKAATGRYTTNVDDLARFYANPRAFPAMLALALDPSTLRIEAAADRFTISARAKDERATLYQVSGPPGKGD